MMHYRFLFTPQKLLSWLTIPNVRYTRTDYRGGFLLVVSAQNCILSVSSQIVPLPTCCDQQRYSLINVAENMK